MRAKLVSFYPTSFFFLQKKKQKEYKWEWKMSTICNSKDNEKENKKIS